MRSAALQVFDSFSKLGTKAKALVVGDFMLDYYTHGSVGRISPEAPVPVLKVAKEESLPGGAGNVALNLVSLGMDVLVAGRIGDDAIGTLLKEAFEKEAINTETMLVDDGYKTPLKNRLIAESQQLLRIDIEDAVPLADAFERKLLQAIHERLNDIDIIAISDYAKGAVTHSFCSHLIEMARHFDIPVIVDPKGTDFSKYAGATLIKPNQHEAYLAAHAEKNVPLTAVAKELLDVTQTEHLIITRSEDGISMFTRDGETQCSPAKSKEVRDVTGAGDTVLACLTAALANKVALQDAIQIANCAASIAIEHLGCYRVTLSEISKRLLQLDTGSKIYSSSQLSALEQVLKKRPYTLIILEDIHELTIDLFTEIQSYTSINVDRQIVVYVKADPVNGDIVSLLSSFNNIDFIIEQPECMRQLMDSVKPKQVLLWDKTCFKDRSIGTPLILAQL